MERKVETFAVEIPDELFSEAARLKPGGPVCSGDAEFLRHLIKLGLEAAEKRRKDMPACGVSPEEVR